MKFGAQRDKEELTDETRISSAAVRELDLASNVLYHHIYDMAEASARLRGKPVRVEKLDVENALNEVLNKLK